MIKKYLVIGNWVDKATGKQVSRIGEISSGLNKNNQPFEMVNTDTYETVEGTYPVGTVLTASFDFTVQERPESTRGLKLGNPK